MKHLKSYLETFITKKMTINDAEQTQDEFNSDLGVLSYYTPKAQKYIEAKNKLLDNAKNVYEGREKIIEGFKNGIFSLNHDNKFEEVARHEEEEKNINTKSEKLFDAPQKITESITEKKIRKKI